MERIYHFLIPNIISVLNCSPNRHHVSWFEKPLNYTIPGTEKKLSLLGQLPSHGEVKIWLMHSSCDHTMMSSVHNKLKADEINWSHFSQVHKNTAKKGYRLSEECGRSWVSLIWSVFSTLHHLKVIFRPYFILYSSYFFLIFAHLWCFGDCSFGVGSWIRFLGFGFQLMGIGAFWVLNINIEE